MARSVTADTTPILTGDVWSFASRNRRAILLANVDFLENVVERIPLCQDLRSDTLQKDDALQKVIFEPGRRRAMCGFRRRPRSRHYADVS